MTNVCHSQPETAKTSDKPPGSWIIQGGSRSCSTGLSFAQVSVPVFLSLCCARGQPRTLLLLFVLLLKCTPFGLVWQGSLLLSLRGLAGLGSLPLLDYSLPAAASPVLLVQHCNKFAFSLLSLSTPRSIVVSEKTGGELAGEQKDRVPQGLMLPVLPLEREAKWHASGGMPGFLS